MASENIQIHSNRLILSDETKKNIIERINRDYYVDNLQIDKIVLNLVCDQSENRHESYTGYIDIYIQNKSKIRTPIKSSDIFSSIFLALEHIYLKQTHSFNNDRSIQEKISVNKKSLLYGSHRPYS